jgi:hypothetical protein
LSEVERMRVLLRTLKAYAVHNGARWRRPMPAAMYARWYIGETCVCAASRMSQHVMGVVCDSCRWRVERGVRCSHVLQVTCGTLATKSSHSGACVATTNRVFYHINDFRPSHARAQLVLPLRPSAQVPPHPHSYIHIFALHFCIVKNHRQW